MSLPIRNAVIAAVITFLAFAVIGIKYGPSPVVGDEMEYYAMVYGWGTYGSPTLSPAVVKAVREAIPGRPAYEPQVVRAVNGTYDAHHFWFISLLDAPFFLLCKASGLDWRHCFTFLNALVFALATGVTYRFFRLAGIGIMLAGAVSSPLLPYMNKAHAEHYTVCLLTIAMLYLQEGRLLATALALSAISTQISAFSPLAAAVLLFCLLRTGLRRLPKNDMGDHRRFRISVSAATGLVLMAPSQNQRADWPGRCLAGHGNAQTDCGDPDRSRYRSVFHVAVMPGHHRARDLGCTAQHHRPHGP